MALPLPVLEILTAGSASEAWRAIFAHAWERCSAPLSEGSAPGDVTRRDREVGGLDLFLASAGWDLWREFEDSVERTATALADWWASRPPGRAVLILDALSLREVPWILQGAAERGYTVHAARATGAELPADTTPFAKALGFAQRSSLENNGAGGSHRLQKAKTECVGIAWADCVGLVGAELDWVFWHHWPDNRVHDLSGAGKAVEGITREASAQLSSDDFWALVERLSTGRRLLVTSDHGYAASGLFADAPEDQGKYLKTVLKSGRWAEAGDDDAPWVPPVVMQVKSAHGENRYALGRRKWKSPGGYPTLVHGGLSVLEVASPFIELSRTT